MAENSNKEKSIHYKNRSEEQRISLSIMLENSEEQAGKRDSKVTFNPFKKVKNEFQYEIQAQNNSEQQKVNRDLSPNENNFAKNNSLFSFSQFPSENCNISTFKSIYPANKVQAISEPSQSDSKSEKIVPNSNKIIPSSQYVLDKKITFEYEEDQQAQFISKKDLQVAQIFQFKNISKKELLETFIAFSSRNNMKLSSQIDNKTIVKGYYTIDDKKQNSAIIRLKSIFSFCLPSNQKQCDIFQLKTYTSGLKKAKITLLSGKQPKFTHFKNLLLANLWEKHQINCTTNEEVRYFFILNEQSFKHLQNKIYKFCQNYSEQAEIVLETRKNESINIIINELKMKEEFIKEKMARQRGMSPSIERLIINKFYQQLQLADLMESYVTKQRIQYFNKKKQKIKQDLSIREIFAKLELKQLYNHISKTVKETKSQQLSEIPFLKSISALQSLNLKVTPSPYHCFEVISLYSMELYKSYNQYYKNTVKSGQDIENLQLTIYCLLMSQSPQIWQTVRFLRQFWNNDKPGYKKEFKCIQTIEKAIFCIIEKKKF